jgi:hypothetical protein
MDMGVDHSGHDKTAAEIDRLDTARRLARALAGRDDSPLSHV